MMTKFLFTSFLLFLTTLVSAQIWQPSFEDAKAKAEQDGKDIILTFSGSDWCIPCMKLEKSIWSSPEFIDYARDHYVMYRADFPKKKADALPKEQQDANDKLAEKYNRQGLFPLVLVLDKTGKVLGSAGYKNVSPREYINLLNSFEKSQQ